jgi:hypothetical protein
VLLMFLLFYPTDRVCWWGALVGILAGTVVERMRS